MAFCTNPSPLSVPKSQFLDFGWISGSWQLIMGLEAHGHSAHGWPEGGLVLVALWCPPPWGLTAVKSCPDLEVPFSLLPPARRQGVGNKACHPKGTSQDLRGSPWEGTGSRTDLAGSGWLSASLLLQVRLCQGENKFQWSTAGQCLELCSSMGSQTPILQPTPRSRHLIAWTYLLHLMVSEKQ